MSLTILEVLENAEYNLSHNHITIALDQLQNALQQINDLNKELDDNFEEK